jgi:hypothetical protein
MDLTSLLTITKLRILPINSGHLGTSAVEVKSGRPRKTSGMNAFLKLFPKAVPKIVTIEDRMSLEDQSFD